MQFIANGPDIPENLLQAHEEGQVVFFCGAGISYPAGLPQFQGLVEAIYQKLKTPYFDIEHTAFSREQYDATLDLLERRLPGQRFELRTALAQVLKPNLRRKGAIDTHAALLQLGQQRDGTLRLVTTNFDRLFEIAAKRSKQKVSSHAAPMLPIAKHHRWNGLVYLHGLLPSTPNESDLNRLVLTSGDFGLAYLTERWAARFVTELFRQYVVCFIGYSINDPVLRYMMDAIAADRMLGEETPQAYAFVECKKGEEKQQALKWEAKGIAPILYAPDNHHTALHDTVRRWADTWRSGVLGKERIVIDYAYARPSASTKQDDFVGRMLWALTDSGGTPAKKFADLNPVPALEWLDAFSEPRFGHSDLARFGVAPNSKPDNELRFSLTGRPTPYTHASRMSLTCGTGWHQGLDDVMFQLGRWLTRHLDDPALLHWVVQHGGQLHNTWALLIEQTLRQISQYEEGDDEEKLEELRKGAPSAIPRPSMRRLWGLLLTGRIKNRTRDTDLYHWKDKLKFLGFSANLRLELREILAPRIVLKKPFRLTEASTSSTPATLKDIVDFELVLASDHVYSAINSLRDKTWEELLPLLLDDFQQLLRDALDLVSELDEEASVYDDSSYHLPSIKPHYQNRGFHDWVILIELTRDAWQAVRQKAPDRAARIAKTWFDIPYLAFKRLALFAASQNNCIDSAEWVEWLLVGDARWLWCAEARRETLRLLVEQGSSLTADGKQRLEAAILAGPPDHLYRDGIDKELLTEIKDQSIWLRLEKLNLSTPALGNNAHSRLSTLRLQYPQWKLAQDESDEFCHWMTGTGDPGFKPHREVDIAPRKRRELVVWLRKPRENSSPFYRDTWTETCRSRFFHSIGALCDLGREDEWPVGYWREALQTWSEDTHVLKTWTWISPLVLSMPEDVLVTLAGTVSWWLKTVSKQLDRYEAVLLDISRRLLDLQITESTGITRNGEPIDEPVSEAINHPIGHTTQAILDLWFVQEPNDNDGLPTDIEPLLTKLTNVAVPRYRHGRVLLAAHLISLFRVDQQWTRRHILPLFDWENDRSEARSAWEGFLWSPRLYQPLIIAFKPQLLSTPSHYVELASHRSQFARFLTFAALEPIEGYTYEDYQLAFLGLPPEGLSEAVRALSQAQEGAGDQREMYWKSRVHPFLESVWPKSRDIASPQIAEGLALMCIATGSEFPAALTAVKSWLQSVNHPDYIISRLEESGLCSQFPEEALVLLAAIAGSPRWPLSNLSRCLSATLNAKPQLETSYPYKKLFELVRRFEG